ncbi:MAG: hypothetical protein ACI9P7_001636 [Candidatus Azotimanducaceae bacterium]|jgi:hypothetical protein
MLENLGHIDHPAQLLASQPPGFAYFSFDHESSYLKEPKMHRLQVLWLKHAGELWVSIFQNSNFEIDGLSGELSHQFEQLATRHYLATLNLNKPWPLDSVRIPKPWGAEVWFTGIEERGVCSVRGIPLPWLTDLLPQSLVGSAAGTAPLLLKILDPLPDQNLGDLYFELHEKKIEVYIVTAVDEKVWPDGTGKIRYGFNQFLRASYPGDEAFKTAYLTAVNAYRQTRIEIDERLDHKKQQSGLAPNSEVPPELMTSWLQQLPEVLTKKESALRSNMHRFTHLRDIRKGDVITVEPFFPHSLLHGVRVIEFQTASYERYILSFAQKVLTQSHWDTEIGLAKALMDLPIAADLPVLEASGGVKIEEIANFNAFTAKRFTLSRGSTHTLGTTDDYRLIMGVSGQADIGHSKCESEEAFLIPAQTGGTTIRAVTDTVVLVAEPKV